MLNIEEATKFLGISKSTIKRWEKSGKIKSYRTIGKHRRYDEKELEKFKKEIMGDES